MYIGCEVSLNLIVTTTAQKILDTSVDMAAPATPMPKPNIRIAFPPILRKLDIIDIVIGVLLFFCALIIDAPASYRPIKGKDNSVYRKYTLELLITSASTEPNINLSIGTLNTRHMVEIDTESSVITRNT